MADLLALARQAIDDEDARVVLSDAIEETGWWDDRIHYQLSVGDDRDEFLACLIWPGSVGKHHAIVLVNALTAERRGEVRR